MATANQLQGLIPSAVELRAGTDWPEWLIEDYLNLLRNIVIISDAVDEVTDDTTRTDASFAEATTFRNAGLIDQLSKRLDDAEQPHIDTQALGAVRKLSKEVEDLNSLAAGWQADTQRLQGMISAQQKRIEDLEQQV